MTRKHKLREASTLGCERGWRTLVGGLAWDVGGSYHLVVGASGVGFMLALRGQSRGKDHFGRG